MFLSQRMGSFKRNATNQLPTDLALPTILSQPTVAFHLLPLSGATQKASPTTKASNPKETVKKPSHTANRKRTVRTKGSQRQESWSEHSIRSDQPRNSAFVGHITCPMDAAKPKHEKAAPRAFICAQNRGVSNPTRFKTILEARKVSPKTGRYKDSRSAKFLH